MMRLLVLYSSRQYATAPAEEKAEAEVLAAGQAEQLLSGREVAEDDLSVQHHREVPAGEVYADNYNLIYKGGHYGNY